MFVVFGVLLLGNNLVPLVLGAAYWPVTANLFLLSLTLWVQILSSVAILLTVVYNYPKTAVMSAVIRLAALWIFGPFLIAKWGSLGGCFAVLLASAICASYLTWRMKRVITLFTKKVGIDHCFGIHLPPAVAAASFMANQCVALCRLRVGLLHPFNSFANHYILRSGCCRTGISFKKCDIQCVKKSRE